MNMLINRLGHPLIGRSGLPILSRHSPDGFSAYRFRPPAMQNPLTIVNLKATGVQNPTGGPNQDLLLVLPTTEFSGQCNVLNSFCNIYVIGGVANPDPILTLTSGGKQFKGLANVFKLYPHPNAISPKIFVGRLKVKTTKIDFGDVINVGSSGGQGSWPDVYRQYVDIDRIAGWDDPTATGANPLVTHSDMYKIEGGGARRSFVANYRAVVGYQEYIGPTYANDFVQHPQSESHYYDSELICFDCPKNKGVLGGVYPGGSDNNAVYLSRGSANVDAGEYNPLYLHQGGADGAGVWLQPNVGQTLASHVHPGGTYAPILDAQGNATWPGKIPAGKTKPLVTGVLRKGRAPVDICPAGEIGFQHRVTTAQQLQLAITG